MIYASFLLGWAMAAFHAELAKVEAERRTQEVTSDGEYLDNCTDTFLRRRCMPPTREALRLLFQQIHDDGKARPTPSSRPNGMTSEETCRTDVRLRGVRRFADHKE